jgi:LPS export ABC transporter protein LptC
MMCNRTAVWVVVLMAAVSGASPAWAARSKGKKVPEASVAPMDMAPGAQQQMDEFYIDYADKGKKSWDLAGKSAVMYDNVVQLTGITGNLYGEKEQVTLVAKNGDFNKADGKVHLQDDVVITTSSGGTLKTDSLDWDNKLQVVSTKDKVNIQRDTMTTTATGAVGQPNLNQMTLQKDVQVAINPSRGPNFAGDNQVLISCDGPLEIDYRTNVAVFKNNVKADRQESVIYCDQMEVHFSREAGTPSIPVSSGAASKDSVAGEAGVRAKASVPEQSPGIDAGKIRKIVCKGNVRIIKGENISYSDEAVYSNDDQKITLTGRPKLVINDVGELKSFGPQ